MAYQFHGALALDLAGLPMLKTGMAEQAQGLLEGQEMAGAGLQAQVAKAQRAPPPEMCREYYSQHQGNCEQATRKHSS